MAGKGNNRVNRAKRVSKVRLGSKANPVSRDNKAARMNARSSAVSTTFPNGCRQQNRAPADRMLRLQKRISIARVNLLTISIRCVDVSMNEHSRVNAANKASRVRISKDKTNKARINRDRASKVKRVNAASKVSKVKKENKDNRVNKARTGSRAKMVKVRTVNNRVPRTASNRAGNKPAVHKTAATDAPVTVSMLDHSGDQWAAIGATIANWALNFANGYAKPRTCVVSGALPV